MMYDIFSPHFILFFMIIIVFLHSFVIVHPCFMQEIEEKNQHWTMRIRPHEKLWHIDLGEIWRYPNLIELLATQISLPTNVSGVNK